MNQNIPFKIANKQYKESVHKPPADLVKQIYVFSEEEKRAKEYLWECVKNKVPFRWDWECLKNDTKNGDDRGNV